MIEHSPYLAITCVALLWAGASATLGDTRLEALTEATAPTVQVVQPPSAPQPEPAAAAVTAAPVRSTAVQVETTTTIPEPARWTHRIPQAYGEGSGCTPDEATYIAHAMWNVGADNDTVMWMLGVISRESTCDPAAHNGNRNTGDDSYGLCQINRLAGWFNTGQLLDDVDPNRFAWDFGYNAAACARLWAECGRGPWNAGNYYCKKPNP